MLYFSSMRLMLATGLAVLLLGACRKDCLQKDKCKLSTYTSEYLEEQSFPEATGITYYVDAKNGTEENNGTSETTPFLSVEQLEGIALMPGDQVLFKRGQIHYGELKISNSGTSDDPIILGDYGEGSLPVLKGRDGFNLSSKVSTLTLKKANYVAVYNLNLQGGNVCITLSNSDHFKIAGCRIGERSTSGLRATSEYSDGDGSDFGEIHHCLFWSGRDGDWGDLQSTDGIQLLDGASNWHVHHNHVKAWAHSGIVIKQIYTLEENNDNLVEHNLFDCGNIDYMRGIDLGGGENLCANNVVRFNIIQHQTVTSHVHGNNNTIAFNLFIGLKTSTATEQPWAMDLHVYKGNPNGANRDDYVCHDIAIHHNLIYNYSEGIGIKVLNSVDGTTNKVQNCAIQNNIIYNTSTCIDLEEEPTALTISNNLFYNDSHGELFAMNSSTMSFADFEAMSGTKSHVITNNVLSDPKMVNPSGKNFALTAGSPAINAGAALGYDVDYAGNPILDVPDIGPFEF